MFPIHRQKPVGFILLALSLLLGGCAAAKPGGNLSIYSPGAHHFFGQNFKEAWYASSHEGEWDIILVNDPTYQNILAHPRGPLQPVAGQPIQQVVHIQVLWKPLRGTEGHTPAVINSTVEWYVFGTQGDRLDMLRYGGAALTNLDFKLGRATVEFRDGTFEVPQRVGPIADPVGASTFDGGAIALKNERRVNEVLQAMREQASRAESGAPPAPAFLP